MASPLIVIPARLASTRLANKPLADIAGQPMIVHVWRRAMESKAGRVLVATDAEAVAEAIGRAGGEAVMTAKNHRSGSDRVFEAATRVDPEASHDVVVNLQGDLPALDPKLIAKCLEPLANPAVDIATLAAEIKEEGERTDPNVVKAVGTPVSPKCLKALYFTRATAPWGEGPLYHHIGIYAFRRAALKRFVALPPTALERREKLEQLRALEAGMRIDIALVDTVPIGVDTAADLERARTFMSAFVGALKAE